MLPQELQKNGAMPGFGVNANWRSCLSWISALLLSRYGAEQALLTWLDSNASGASNN